jgi:mRNA interferase RelE/StbE
MRAIVSPAVERDTRRLTPELMGRVIAQIRRLREDPRPPGCRLLRDYHPPTWRVRVGDWRILYEIDDDAHLVTITGVRHRSKAY